MRERGIEFHIGQLVFVFPHLHERLLSDRLWDVPSVLCRVTEVVSPDGKRPELGASPSCRNI